MSKADKVRNLETVKTLLLFLLIVISFLYLIK